MRLTLLKTAELAFTIEAKKMGGTQQKFKSLDFQKYKKNTLILPAILYIRYISVSGKP